MSRVELKHISLGGMANRRLAWKEDFSLSSTQFIKNDKSGI